MPRLFRSLAALLIPLLPACGSDDLFGPQEEDVAVLEAMARAPTSISYLLVPHPDDEYEGWSLIDKYAGVYKVFVLLTRGEETAYCQTVESGGARGYEGPHSPAGLPDWNEAAPTPFPWSGRWSKECEAARVSSFHHFLDDMAAADPSMSKAPPYKGTVCFGGLLDKGRTPTRSDNQVPREARCAEVWSDSRGARVVFDLGDGDLEPEEVAWALRSVREHRDSLGIPSALPEGSVIAASYYNERYEGCTRYAHTDHRAVHRAVWNVRFDDIPRYGRTCHSDPDSRAAGYTRNVSLSTHARTFAMDGTRRVGPFVRHYGWLNVVNDQVDEAGLFGRTQSFWRR